MGYPSTCFFSVAKSPSGKWWFIDPNGDPFFSLCIVAITYYGDKSNEDGTVHCVVFSHQRLAHHAEHCRDDGDDVNGRRGHLLPGV
jgi:hypothetical protein